MRASLLWVPAAAMIGGKWGGREGSTARRHCVTWRGPVRAQDKIYTCVGDILVAVNPFKWIDGLYGSEVR